MVQKVMRNINLEWRDRGNDTSKTFMDRVARFSIAKVRKSLMPMLLRKTVQEYTRPGVRKRRRGGARRQKFNPEHNIKKENAASGNMTGNNTGNVPPTVAAFSKHQNTDSPMSTITSYSGLKNHELFEGARRHFGATKEPIVFKNRAYKWRGEDIEEGRIMAIFKVPDEHVQTVLALSGREGLIVDKQRPRFEEDQQKKEEHVKIRLLWNLRCRTPSTA